MNNIFEDMIEKFDLEYEEAVQERTRLTKDTGTTYPIILELPLKVRVYLMEKILRDFVLYRKRYNITKIIETEEIIKEAMSGTLGHDIDSANLIMVSKKLIKKLRG
jgi:hypothetical protein